MTEDSFTNKLISMADRLDRLYTENVESIGEIFKKRDKIQSELNRANIELQKRLVQCCIDYINETGNKDIWRVSFTADCLQESAKEGKWMAYTDSACEIEGEDGIVSFI